MRHKKRAATLSDFSHQIDIARPASLNRLIQRKENTKVTIKYQTLKLCGSEITCSRDYFTAKRAYRAPLNQVLTKMPTKNKQGILQNNNEMKIFKTKSILFAIATAMVVVTSLPILQSCSKDDESASKVNYNGVSICKSNSVKVQGSKYEYLDLPEEFQKVGRFHNDGLDSLYNKIQKKKEIKPYITSKEVETEMVVASQNYYESNEIFKPHTTSNVKFSDIYTKTQSLNNIKDTTVLSIKLNLVQKELLAKIRSIIKSECNNKNHSQLAEKLTIINSDAAMKLKNEDANVIYIATSVAFASTQYWQENFDKWAVLLKKGKINKTTRFKITSAEANAYFNSYILPVILADVSGATHYMVETAALAVYTNIVTGGTAAPATFAAFCATIGISAVMSSGWEIFHLCTGATI